MKIAAFNSYLTKKGGGAIAFQNMLVDLKKRGHEITVWTFGISKEFLETFKQNGIEVTSLDMGKWFIGRRQMIVLNYLRAILAFGKFVERSKDIDIVFIHGYEYSPMLAPKMKIPVVYYCQEPPRHYYEPDSANVAGGKRLGKAAGFIPNALDMLIDRYGVGFVDAILTNSDYSREYVWRTYGKMPITVYLGVDVDKFRKLNLEKENMVLAIGGYYYLKAHDFVVRSLSRLPKEKRPKLIVVGKGDRHEEFMQLANKHEVDVEVVDNVTDELLVKLYNRAKATVVAYIMEPFGLVAIESMACETPVVAVKEGGLRESITRETGILTDRHEDKFAKAVLRILEDPHAANEMGRKGRELVKTLFVWERCGENLERILSDVVARKTR